VLRNGFASLTGSPDSGRLDHRAMLRCNNAFISEHFLRALVAILVLIPEDLNLRQSLAGERASMESAMTQAAPIRARFIAFAVQFR
jgi:hypothetical protein